ncbi:MAG: MFS transporter, partial [bacterium]
MLRRFSLYGFLKNQQYYDYFLLLAFRQMGLTYFVIGLLIAFRELMINLLEIPTGGIADLCGRRRSMIFSFMAYIVSFLIFGISGIAASASLGPRGTLIPFLLLAMLFFAVGDAFRTGTHKALIFSWLRIQRRIDDRTKVYGYTRSWSKIGSAVSVLIASVIVLVTNQFFYVFFFTIIPYLLNIINFLGYPKEIDCRLEEKTTLRDIVHHLMDTLMISVRQASLRRLVLESMGFEGFFKASKDYLQPILMAAAMPLTTALFAGF